MNLRVTSIVVLAFGAIGSLACGQEARPRPYDGIQAGIDAYHLADDQRRAAIANQLFLNDQMKYWSGLPTSRGATINYGPPAGYPSTTPLLPPADLDYTYAFGTGGGWRGYRERVWFAPRTVFEPWPIVPGDIYGYVYYPGVRQPIGQHQVQTGPNRWESHPVYDSPPPVPLPPAPTPPPQPPQNRER